MSRKFIDIAVNSVYDEEEKDFVDEGDKSLADLDEVVDDLEKS